jgi:hypothetical protein
MFTVSEPEITVKIVWKKSNQSEIWSVILEFGQTFFDFILTPRPHLHSTGWIWDRSEIRLFWPCKHTRTTELDEFETP